MEAGELKKQGIWICGSLNEVKRLLRTAESAASFRFALLEELPTGEELKELLPLLPFRVLVPKSAGTGQVVPSICTVEDGDWGDIQAGLSAGDVTALWKAWLKRWPEVKAGLSLYVYLDQNTDELPTFQWREWAHRWNRNSGGMNVYVAAMNDVCVAAMNTGETVVVWDRHARVLDRLAQYFHVGRDAWILLDKMSEDFASIFLSRPPGSSQPWTLPLELMEAGLLRVVVVDERVAEQALQPIVDDPHVQETMQGIWRNIGQGDESLCRSRWMAALLARIYIVTHVVKSGECRPLHPAVEKKELLVFDPSGSEGPVRPGSLFQGEGIAEVIGKFDMLIVHHGVLEDLCGSDREKIREFLNGLGHKFPFIVIESGRGVPATLPGDVKFLPFSVVGRCLLGRRIAKYRLVRTVMGLTRRG